MYEVAQVAGNKVEAACALQSLSNIMGQITSSHHGGSSSSSTASKHSKLPHRHSTVVPKNTDEPIYQRDMYKLRESQKRRKGATVNSNGPSTGIQNARPITISEMNAYNAEKSNEGAKDNGSLINNTNNNNNVNNSINGSNGSSGATSIKSTSSASTKKKEFITDGEAYHKTDSCFYKRPDGGFHKLPPDSYHKMSEICYNKMPDGSFKRIDEILAMKNSNSMSDHTSQTNQHSNQNKIRNPMMRFLKRSKSHTPATIKEMQKAKEKEREQRLAAANNSGATNHSSTNRKVVVTMMENGGLPIVATSKSTRREHSTRDSNKENRNKDNKVTKILFIHSIKNKE